MNQNPNDQILFHSTMSLNSKLTLHKDQNGLITENDTLRVVCQALPEMITFDEYSDYLDYALDVAMDVPNRVLDSVDGTHIRIYYYENSWRIATNNCLNAFKAYWNPRISFGRMTIEAMKAMNITCEDWDRSYTYFFTLCHPRNRIVTRYTHPMLFHVDTMDSEGNHVNERVRNAYRPKEYSYNDFLHYVGLARNRVYDREGVVIVYDQVRCRVRNPNYVHVFNIRGNCPSPLFRYLEIYKNNADRLEEKMDEFFYFYPEYTWTRDMVAHYARQCNLSHDDLVKLPTKEVFNRIRDEHKKNPISRFSNLYENRMPRVYENVF